MASKKLLIQSSTRFEACRAELATGHGRLGVQEIAFVQMKYVVASILEHFKLEPFCTKKLAFVLMLTAYMKSVAQNEGAVEPGVLQPLIVAAMNEANATGIKFIAAPSAA
ncbi:cytochrome P450-like protein [Striga asiatica]|uniref:Cytochrome P450-like protein n=1 Tax=Striga asiatica TaxID=4170 RepID=A0A5A7REY3_STRAF|nr:cytochrome P450-like protein [Striga asiatica]